MAPSLRRARRVRYGSCRITTNATTTTTTLAAGAREDPDSYQSCVTCICLPKTQGAMSNTSRQSNTKPNTKHTVVGSINGGACKSDCQCGRHSRAKKRHIYEDVVCNAQGCDDPAVADWLCMKCYHRRRRNGVPALKVKLLKPEMPPNKLARGRKPPYRCLCGHLSPSHRYGEQCVHEGCDCKVCVETNEDFYQQLLLELATLGFIMHINEIATCSVCYDSVEIGRWHDPFVKRRAVNHIRDRHPQEIPVALTGRRKVG